MTSIPAVALTPVHHYKGNCSLVLSKKAIEVRNDKEESLGTWAFEFIRRFHCQDTSFFSFTSGRRGPYGVNDYTFRLKEEDLMQLQSLLSQHTGAKFDSAPRNARSSTVSSSDSYTQVNPDKLQPGYMLMTPGKFETLPTGLSSSPGSPLTPPIPSLISTMKDRKSSYDKLESSFEGISPLVIAASTDRTDGGALFSPSSTFTKKEIKQLKKFDKEPLINKSPTVHVRRNAEYIDIDLPDTASEGSGSLDSGWSMYDVPTNSRQSTYDFPPPPKPTIPKNTYMYDVPSSIISENTYDVPSSMISENTYDVPSSHPSTVSSKSEGDSHIKLPANLPPSTQQQTETSGNSSRSSSMSPTNRALPHLPTDYENVKPAPNKKHSVGGYVNVGFHPSKPSLETETGLYMEVPLSGKPQSSKSLTNIYTDIPERMESQLTIRRVESDQPPPTTANTAGSKIAKALEEEGYEFINPAMLPALKSPPIAPSVNTVTEEDEGDMYVEVHRPSPILSIHQEVPPPGTPTFIPKEKKDGRRSSVDFCKVTSRSKRASDGYEEITDVVRELKERSPPSSNKPGGRLTPETDHEKVDRRGSTSPVGRRSTSPIEQRRSNSPMVVEGSTVCYADEKQSSNASVPESNTLPTQSSSYKPLAPKRQSSLSSEHSTNTTAPRSPQLLTKHSSISENHHHCSPVGSPKPPSRHSSNGSEHSTRLPLSRHSSNDSSDEDHASSFNNRSFIPIRTPSNEPINPGPSSSDVPMGRSSPSTKLVFNGEIAEYPEEFGDDEDFEEVTISHSFSGDLSKERSTSDPSNSSPGPKTRTVSISQSSKFINNSRTGSPDQENTTSSVLRKRSSTVGDITDSKEPKKHTYVNVPEGGTSMGVMSPAPAIRSFTSELSKKKPPMPLPRPPSVKNMSLPRQPSVTAVIDPCVNGNNSNNKVRTLVRQFSEN